MLVALQYARQSVEQALFFLIFFTIVTPVGAVMRLSGRDRLQLDMRQKTTLLRQRDHVFTKADLESAF